MDYFSYIYIVNEDIIKTNCYENYQQKSVRLSKF